MVGDVAESVPRHRHHAKFETEVCKARDVPVVEWPNFARHPFARRAKHLDAVPRGQCLDSPDVVGVMVGHEDGPEREALLLERDVHGSGVSRIHHHRKAPVARRADQPEVVVRKSPYRAHFEHRRPSSPERLSPDRAY